MTKSIIVCLCVIMLSACAQPHEYRPIIEQQSLLQKCSYDTPVPTNFVLDKDGKKMYSGKEFMRVLVEWQDVYNECATMHDSLVDTILKLENERQIKKG